MNGSENASVNKMEVKPVLPLIVQMSLPPLISMCMQYSYNLVDCMFVSWMSEDALTAVSLMFPITTLMCAVAIWIGVGVNVLIAKYLGQKDQAAADRTVSNGILLAAVVGALVTAAALAVIESFTASFTDDPEICGLAVQYMEICAFMGVPCSVHLCIQKILQGTGNMIAPMWFQIAGVVFNFVFDPILIFGYFGFPALGIRGAAVATVGGYTVSMVLAFYVLLFRKQRVQLRLRGFRVDVPLLANIFAVGFPSFVMNALGALMTTFTNHFLVAYSTTAVAFFGAYFKIQQLVIMTMNGLVQGCIPIMSYNFGAGKDARLRQTLRYGTLIAVVLTGASILVLWLFPAQILRAFKASEEMLGFGVAALRIMCVSYLFAGISTMIASFFQATKRVMHSLLINLLRQLLLLLPFMWLLSRLGGMEGVWWSFLAAEVLTTGIATAIYRRTRSRDRSLGPAPRSEARR